jgi:hypothetical protein
MPRLSHAAQHPVSESDSFRDHLENGTKIVDFMLNGGQPEPFVPAGLTGAQRVEIILTHANG